MRWLLGYMAAVCILLIIVSQSIIFPSFHMPFFRWQFERLEIAYNVQISDADLQHVTTQLLDYMRGNRESLDSIYATVAGQERDFFNDVEKRHMMDVRNLYNIAYTTRNVSFFLFVGLALGMALLRMPLLYVLARCTREVIAAFLLIGFIVAGFTAANFARAFDIFHLMFFPYNTDWMLNPTQDLLVNIVPAGFFAHIAIFIGTIMATVSLLAITISSIYLYRLPRNVQVAL